MYDDDNDGGGGGGDADDGADGADGADGDDDDGSGGNLVRTRAAQVPPERLTPLAPEGKPSFQKELAAVESLKFTL